MANLTESDMPALLEALRTTGQARLRNLGHDFNELEFLLGAATVIEALAPGETDERGERRTSKLIPAAWFLLVPVGRSWVDPDEKIAQELGLERCIYCGKPATTEVEGDPFCDKCQEEI